MHFRRFRPSTDPAVTQVRRKPALDFSVNGLVFCSMMMFMGLAAVNSQANLLFAVFGLMIGVLLVSGTISRMVLRRLNVRRVLPEHAVVGQRVTLTYECANGKKFWPSLSVTVAELAGSEAFTRQPLAYMLHAAPGATAVIATDVFPKRRGLHPLERFQVSTSFPFGFIKRAHERKHRETLLVYPAIGRVDPKLLLLCQSAERSGAMLRPRRGGTDEFYGVKEYRAGENPRHIYWKRSAATGTLVSKEMTLVSPPRLLLLVDTFLPDRTPAGHGLVEEAVAMAGSLATHALEAGLMVGVCAWSGGPSGTPGRWIGLNPNRGKRHRRDVMTALAQLGLNQEKDSRALLDHGQAMLKSATTPVLLTPRPFDAGPNDPSRGGLITVAAGSPQARGWFKFDPEVNFQVSMPPDQQPTGMEGKRHGGKKGGRTK